MTLKRSDPPPVDEDPEEGDTVIELRNGVPHVYTQPATPTLTKAQVNYRTGSTWQHCGNCTMFRSPHGCTLVKGNIVASGVCDKWDGKTGITKQ
jgi:hypothetical protein